MKKSEQKQHLIDMMKGDEDLGLYEEPKQKTTLEEAAEHNYPGGDDWTEEQAVIRRLAFKNGAKYQAERMYSEEDMAESFMACWKANVSDGIECKLSFKEWFEQFKKK
jgi:hypothetical protein